MPHGQVPAYPGEDFTAHYWYKYANTCINSHIPNSSASEQHCHQATANKLIVQSGASLLHWYRPHTRDAPLSLAAESLPLSSSSSSSFHSCLSASWSCSCRGCLPRSSPPRHLDWGFEGSAAEINGDVMAAVTVIRYSFLMEEWTAFPLLDTDQLPRAAQRTKSTGRLSHMSIFWPLLSAFH